MNGITIGRAMTPAFLSCLFGSEHGGVGLPNGDDFLSCLFGSERVCVQAGVCAQFLSCLFGSERRR